MRVALAVGSLVLVGLALGAQSASSDMAPPIPSGNWSGGGGVRVSWADRLHGWRLAGRREHSYPPFTRIEATVDGGKRWTTVLRMLRRSDGIAYVNRLSERVGVALVSTRVGRRTLLSVDKGRDWHVIEGGRDWRLVEGDARTVYLSPYDLLAPSSRLYRLGRWPSTRPRYILVHDAAGSIVSLRKAPDGVVALVEPGRYEYSVAIHRKGRTRVFRVPTTSLDATPQTCEAFRFSVRWPVLSLVTQGGARCEEFPVEHISRDGGRTWQATPGYPQTRPFRLSQTRRAAERKNPPMRAFSGGAYRDRTGDLRLAKPALSQLS